MHFFIRQVRTCVYVSLDKLRTIKELHLVVMVTRASLAGLFETPAFFVYEIVSPPPSYSLEYHLKTNFESGNESESEQDSSLG